MKGNFPFLSALAVASLLLQPANANLCTLRPNQTADNYFDWNSIIVSDPLDLMTALDGCTIVDGNVMISDDYNGPFNLAVTNFSGIISQPSPPGTANITEFLMPQATYVRTIDLQNVPALETIYLPEVTQISSLVLYGSSTVKVDCGSLVNANVLNLEGFALNVNFSMLAQVNSVLSISADFYAPEFDLDFPSLLNATSISMTGNISSLSMPNLAVALAENLGLGLYDTFGLQIGSYGVPLVVDFPSLSNATGIQLLGDIKSISFPSLFTLDGLFSMTSNLPFAVNLTTLQSVLAISLAGKISSFSMPAIQDIQTWVEVSSDVPLDCTTAHNQFLKANSNYVAGSQPGSVAHVFACESFAKKHLSTGARVGIAFGIFVSVAVSVLVLARMIMKRMRAKRNILAAAPSSDYELEQRVSTRVDAPPPYADSMTSEIGQLVEPKSLL